MYSTKQQDVTTYTVATDACRSFTNWSARFLFACAGMMLQWRQLGLLWRSIFHLSKEARRQPLVNTRVSNQH